MFGRLLTAFISLKNQAYDNEMQTVENRMIDTYHGGLYIYDQNRIIYL